MTLTTDPIDCTGCTRQITVADLCVHTAPTCSLCCGTFCGNRRDPWDNGVPIDNPFDHEPDETGWNTGGRRSA